jgi:hypothetical protein
MLDAGTTHDLLIRNGNGHNCSKMGSRAEKMRIKREKDKEEKLRRWSNQFL